MSLAKCRYSRIGSPSGEGGISGGERKRLNVASEIATLPPILFADEPTTGLDSFMAESVTNVLQDMVQSGRLVIATIHQPSSRIFEAFDDVSSGETSGSSNGASHHTKIYIYVHVYFDFCG